MELVHKDATKGSVEFLRVWIFGAWLFIILFRFQPIDFRFLPSGYFEPTGLLLRYVPAPLNAMMVTEVFLSALKIALVISLSCLILGRSVKFNSVFSALLLTVQQALVRGFGHINHGEIILLYAAYIMSAFFLFSCQHSGSELQRRGLNVHSIPYVSILFLLCFSYFLTGMRRLLEGGWDLFMSDTILLMIVRNSSWSAALSWPLDSYVMNSPLLRGSFKLGFPIITLFEVLAPFSLVSRHFRYAFLLVMLAFHIFSWVFLGILFWENLLLFILFSERISRYKGALGEFLIPKRVETGTSGCRARTV